MFERDRNLSWRGEKKEGYIKLEKNLFVKEDDIEYYTEQDLIKKVSEVKNIPKDVTADFYRVLMMYLKTFLDKETEDIGYTIKNYGYIFKRVLDVRHLLKNKDSVKFKKAKSQLDIYMCRTRDHVYKVI